MKKAAFALLLSLCLLLSACRLSTQPLQNEPVLQESIPPFTGEAYVAIGNNAPLFSSEELTCEAFEYYSPLDSLGRCAVAYACIGPELMPTEERGSIGQVKPSGWQREKYDFVDGKYLYNRCHLIGYQLTGENANERNLITGTRYLNTQGMLPFENLVADYIKETGNHVLYRVTPDFKGNELVARGVYMEGLSVEDNGEGVCFYVYVYNNQPNVSIDYATGKSRLDVSQTDNPGETETYILNTNSKKFHKETCPGASQISQRNKEYFTGTREELIENGYEPCGSCRP